MIRLYGCEFGRNYVIAQLCKLFEIRIREIYTVHDKYI